MNQAIQFPDRENWDEAQQAICFPAMVNGFQLTCAITVKELRQRFLEEGEPLEIFRRHRWDLEDQAQSLIEDQQEDSQGWVWLS
ncbi:MAG: DUF1488 domain-containing protein [Mixta calida]|uniref:DUF1488 domain-containing protein n=1 Tax=Mixta calida TaxID=665913 RepID=A0ABM6RX26_9GAMM|nr:MULTISPECIES: DUF1488 domain-containing protein [Mixta]AIX75703.1 hypothetical protein PSNIH2_19340 [Pantoea sp. PSNIH2]MBS6059896.1 DUF1488 domain-containing protein [Pantoea sp.]POU50534.1 DUF1488 domain-containing protein [Pantoea sp. PSNIH5]POU58963.1 DUF1488 domain-containing protein [Pantoea sp. PSNIH4]POY69084.1 DUF1488 domain-containing protein [Pantoea sp. PSNIH3]